MELAIIEAVEAAEAADKQKVTCYVCDKEFKTESAKNKHQKIHFEGQHLCKFCGKSFVEIGNRNKHEQQVHTTQTFKCKKCDKLFKLERSLKVHMQKKHSGEEDSDGAGTAAAEAPVATVPSTLEPQQEEEDLERTLEAVESDMEEVEEVEVEVEVCLTDHLDVLDNSAWVSNEVTLSSEGAEDEDGYWFAHSRSCQRVEE